MIPSLMETPGVVGSLVPGSNPMGATSRPDGWGQVTCPSASSSLKGGEWRRHLLGLFYDKAKVTHVKLLSTVPGLSGGTCHPLL